MTASDDVIVERLEPGVHVLENRNLHEPSPKVERVRELLEPALDVSPDVLLAQLPTVLADHQTPCGEPLVDNGNVRLALAARAICVHADEDDYGTRSSAIITVAGDLAPPIIRWTDEAPCHERWHESDDLWGPRARPPRGILRP